MANPTAADCVVVFSSHFCVVIVFVVDLCLYVYVVTLFEPNHELFPIFVCNQPKHNKAISEKKSGMQWNSITHDESRKKKKTHRRL